MHEAYLPCGSLNILLGDVPAKDHLKKLEFAFRGTHFKQVVFLRSENLVQLCNFMRRCRTERTLYKYLVIFEFTPHRDALHFLHIFRQLNVTLVVAGGVCRGKYVAELMGNSPHALLEWTGLERNGSPVFFCQTCATPRTKGVVATGHDALLRGDAEVETKIDAWPLYNLAAFQSYQTYSRSAGDAFQSSHSSDNTKRAPNHSRGGMTLARACEVLGVLESQHADAAFVRKQYYTRAMKLHPDKQPESQRAAASQIFAELSAAKEFLDTIGGSQQKV